MPFFIQFQQFSSNVDLRIPKLDFRVKRENAIIFAGKYRASQFLCDRNPGRVCLKNRSSRRASAQIPP
jgi:hypothetical protein